MEKHQGWVEEITDLNPVDQRVYMNLRLWLPGNKEIKAARVSYRIYTLVEIQSLLKQAGLSYHSVYGDFGLHHYALDSERMIVLCTKNTE